MKTIFRIILPLVIGSCAAATIRGQEAPESGAPAGFIRLANAVAQGDGKLKLEIDGESVSADGYQIGDVTGGIRVTVGSHQVKVSRNGVKEGSTRLNVALNETVILIPFGEELPAADKEPVHWKIRILRLKQREPEAGLSGTFVSVCRMPEIRVDVREPGGRWNPVFVKRLTVAQAPLLYPRGYVPLKAGNLKLDPIPVSEPGNYVVLLYEDAAGSMQSLNFMDCKFAGPD